MLRIKLIRSPIAHNWRIRRTVEALGLRKMNTTVEQPDNPSIRGLVHHVKELLLVEDMETGTVIFDGAKHRPHATRKQKKPSERH